MIMTDYPLWIIPKRRDHASYFKFFTDIFYDIFVSVTISVEFLLIYFQCAEYTSHAAKILIKILEDMALQCASYYGIHYLV